MSPKCRYSNLFRLYLRLVAFERTYTSCFSKFLSSLSLSLSLFFMLFHALVWAIILVFAFLYRLRIMEVINLMREEKSKERDINLTATRKIVDTNFSLRPLRWRSTDDREIYSFELQCNIISSVWCTITIHKLWTWEKCLVLEFGSFGFSRTLSVQVEGKYDRVFNDCHHRWYLPLDCGEFCAALLTDTAVIILSYNKFSLYSRFRN